jgi:CRISPR-associated protein Cmr6
MSQVNLKQSSISSEIKADPLARPLKNGKIQHRKSMFNDISVTSKALTWLHKKGDENYAIKKTHLSGELGKIGRIWHRMYPRFVKQDDRVVQRGFVELLTIFPNRQAQGKEYKKQQDFLNFLSQQSDFKKVFGN